jgi:hypothetical protein
MTTSIPTRLRAIRAFLESEILPGVPPEVRSDMRATLKMLENMEAEVDRLPALVDSEKREMLRLCEMAIAALGNHNLPGDELQAFEGFVLQRDKPFKAFGDALAEHAELSMLLGRLTARLSERIDAEPEGLTCSSASKSVFTKCCRFMVRQAQARAGWQAVFPSSGLYREDRNEAETGGSTA